MYSIGIPSSSKGRSFAQLTGVRYPQDALPFVIPNLHADIKAGMTLTMRLALQDRDPLVQGMFADAVSYFEHLAQVLKQARAGSSLDLVRANKLVSVREAVEIGFGYSAVGRAGSGVGDGALNTHLLRILLEHPGMADLLAKQPDGLFFIPGFGLDRVSDVFAAAIRTRLIRFTQEQMRLHRFDPSCLASKVVTQQWNPVSLRFEESVEELPVADDGRAIILVPKKVVRSAAPVTAQQYERFYRLPRTDMGQLKQRILADNRKSSAKLLRLMERIFEDEWRWRPRREFRDD